ncbi:MAG: DUF4221 family protein [Bacteroidota bacterium]|jgi:hypothetical protein|nr:DUF4221 family protein [Cytophagales bacterium]
MKFSTEITFPIDTATNANLSAIAIYPQSQPKFFITHHPSQNVISVFSLNERRLVKKIHVNEDGPSGVGDGIRGMYVHNFDSIFLMAPLEQRIYLIDSSAFLRKKYSVANDKGYAIMDITNSAYIQNELLYLSAYPPPLRLSTSSDFAVLVLNLNTGELTSEFNLTKEYDRGHWGKHIYFRSRLLYDDENMRQIVSFPNDNYLHVQNHSGSIEKKFAGSAEINTLKPLDTKYVDDDEKNYKLAARQGSYGSLYYDHWNKLFYRLANNPIKSEYSSPFDTVLNPVLIILDENLFKIGEFKLPSNVYRTSYVFITPDGLHIFNVKKYNKDEDFFYFDVFRPVKKSD